MATFAELKSQQITARKAGNAAAIPILTTLVGDLQANAKLVDGEKTVTDDEVMAMIRKFLKGAKETLTHDPDNGQIAFEKDLLEGLLPQQMTVEEIEDAVKQIIADGADTMGVVMGQLKIRHGGLYDGKTASQVVKAALA